MTDKFNVKWNDFGANVSKSFGLLRNEESLYDVTLVTNDSEILSAHKFVLSSCSKYFRNIFKQTKQTQPMICLDGVSSSDLQNILDYVYNGEVSILQDQLDTFMKVGQRFKIEGLVGDVNTNEESNTNKESFLISCWY